MHSSFHVQAKLGLKTWLGAYRSSELSLNSSLQRHFGKMLACTFKRLQLFSTSRLKAKKKLTQTTVLS